MNFRANEKNHSNVLQKVTKDLNFKLQQFQELFDPEDDVFRHKESHHQIVKTEKHQNVRFVTACSLIAIYGILVSNSKSENQGKVSCRKEATW